MSFGTLPSRAAVVNRILPSRIAGGSGSPLMPTQVPPVHSGSDLQGAPSPVPPTQRPVMVETGPARTSGTQFDERTHGPMVPHSASVVHDAPPG
jgi:hypothetical protein